MLAVREHTGMPFGAVAVTRSTVVLARRSVLEPCIRVVEDGWPGGSRSTIQLPFFVPDPVWGVLLASIFEVARSVMPWGIWSAAWDNLEALAAADAVDVEVGVEREDPAV
ncbi:MAG: hypothetical protein ACYCZM_14125, partial [Acidimicrobiales bacterium]